MDNLRLENETGMERPHSCNLTRNFASPQVGLRILIPPTLRVHAWKMWSYPLVWLGSSRSRIHAVPCDSHTTLLSLSRRAHVQGTSRRKNGHRAVRSARLPAPVGSLWQRLANDEMHARASRMPLPVRCPSRPDGRCAAKEGLCLNAKRITSQ